MNKETILVAGAINVVRAAQVAIIAELPISFYRDVNHEQKEADQLQSLSDLYCELLSCIDFTTDSGLLIELHLVPESVYTDSRKYKPLAEFIQEALDAKALNLEVDTTLNEGSKQLLKTAIHRLSLTADQVEIVYKSAKAIAILDGATQVRTEHLAEALQYQSIDKEYSVSLNEGGYYCINSQGAPVVHPVIKFANGVKFTQDQIQEAVQYLLKNQA